ncbi:MAG: hypothetical protein KDB54_09750 [Solirubrobacterales bacterium]|nr:hypothetical protein [Solirubrobacterales bacterium]
MGRIGGRFVVCLTVLAIAGCSGAAGVHAESQAAPEVRNHSPASASAYRGHKFNLQQAGCYDGGQIKVFPPLKYQVNSWYYGHPDHYYEKIWWRAKISRYTRGKWRPYRTGQWSWSYVNIVGLVPTFYDIYGQGHYWRTGTGGTIFTPFNGLRAGYYAVYQVAYWAASKKKRTKFTPIYPDARSYCTFV